MMLLKPAILAAGIALLSLLGTAQSPPANSPPPRSQDSTQTEPSAKSKQQNPAASNTSGESSSKATIIDISPPVGDVQEHPESEAAHESVNELKPWDPHRAAKDIEVGEYYFKRKNYRGAESRFRDALLYKPNDASKDPSPRPLRRGSPQGAGEIVSGKVRKDFSPRVSSSGYWLLATDF